MDVQDFEHMWRCVYPIRRRSPPRQQITYNDEDLPWNAKCFWLKYRDGYYHPRAVFVGIDKDGGNLYVGRANHGGDLVPAKVVPNHSCAYLAWKGNEVWKNEYEVLVLGSGHVEWQKAQNGDVPARALPVGMTGEGEVSYSARAHIDGTITPGKLVPSDGSCYISYDVRDHKFDEYEVLTIF